jgi:positive regulator of sigma E activity
MRVPKVISKLRIISETKICIKQKIEILLKNGTEVEVEINDENYYFYSLLIFFIPVEDPNSFTSLLE